jgi:hypothetical protein
MAALVLVSLCAVGASTLSVGAAQGSSTNVQAPTVVGAPVGAGAPAACSVNGTPSLDLFIRGADNYLYLKTSTDGTAWPSGATSLGGVLTSSPAATVRDTNTVTVFARGSDGAIWYRDSKNAGVSFGNWVSIGGAVAANTGPAVCSWGGGRLDVFVQGTNSGMYHKSWTDQKGWSGWDYLGGVLTSAPAATATSDGNQIGVFVRGNDGGVWYRHYDASSSWGSWTSVGGQVLAGTSPAAFNWGSRLIGWFVTGATNQHLFYSWEQFTPGGQTSGYADLGGYLTSSPGATAKAPGYVDVFARGGSGDFTILWQKSYGPSYVGGWSDWTSITFP